MKTDLVVSHVAIFSGRSADSPRHPRRAFWPALTAALLVSCAAPLRYEVPADPLSVLPPGATVYLRLGRASLLDFAPAMLASLDVAPADSKYLGAFLDRTDVAAIAFLPDDGAAGATATAGLPRLEAVFLGAYPARSAAFALRRNREWKPDSRGRAFVSARRGLAIAFPGPGLALAAAAGGGTVDEATRAAKAEASIEGLAERLLSPGADVMPASLSALSESDIAIWVPDPFGGLAEAILGPGEAADIDVPSIGVLVAARREGASPEEAGADPDYELSVVFLMRNEEEARTFRPALRLAWYGLCRTFAPGDAGIASLRFELAGDTVAAGGIRVKASSIAAALPMVRRAAGPSGTAR